MKQSSICLMVLDFSLQNLIISRPFMKGAGYISLIRLSMTMQRSVSHGNTVKSAFLIMIMIIMTQVGYLDLINSPTSGNDSFDDESSVMETGGSGSSNNLTPSVEGANLLIDEPMTNITFQYNASAANGSGSGSNSGTYNGNGTAWMVKDIRSGFTSSSPTSLTAVGNTLYFFANDYTHGSELWKSDGTASGTVMVKDIRSGSTGSNPGDLTAIGNTLYFRADDDTHGSELWKSDGTASGTVMVKDINSLTTPTIYLHSLTAVGNTLYFQADDGTNGSELWKSDGTASGTVMVKDIRSGSTGSNPTLLTAVGNTLYFRANDGSNGKEMWKSDGTSSGTVMVKESAADLAAVNPPTSQSLATPYIS
ncbi:MAG: hypothetical protein L7T81_01925 [Candidatus Poseidoniaceae archaeon]|nr:hypothetical protein [Candidatus Poseidoniaceae archaeon]